MNHCKEIKFNYNISISTYMHLTHCIRLKIPDLDLKMGWLYE